MGCRLLGRLFRSDPSRWRPGAGKSCGAAGPRSPHETRRQTGDALFDFDTLKQGDKAPPGVTADQRVGDRSKDQLSYGCLRGDAGEAVPVCVGMTYSLSCGWTGVAYMCGISRFGVLIPIHVSYCCLLSTHTVSSPSVVVFSAIHGVLPVLISASLGHLTVKVVSLDVLVQSKARLSSFPGARVYV